jgi:hypothetical protein
LFIEIPKNPIADIMKSKRAEKIWLSAFLLLALLLTLPAALDAQAVPSKEENIPFLVTSGQDMPADWGDDDHIQIFFFAIPSDVTDPVFIRVFDPDVGGKHDEVKGEWNTRCRFSVVGGKGAYSHPDARSVNPTGEFDRGTLLFSKTFGVNDKYDDKWYTFGPINPTEGEIYRAGEKNLWILKVIAQGLAGDDGNLYRYYMSSSAERNTPLEGGKAFTFEYSFRVPKGKCHLYPYVDKNVVSIIQSNFDYDSDGWIKLVSVARKSERMATSLNGQWIESKHKIYEAEWGNSLDIQIFSLTEKRNNNLVLYLTNQYGESLPFYNAPIGIIAPDLKVIVEPDE